MKKKDKTTAGLLAILLPGLGVHNFYLNRIGRGVIDILFCWTFIPQLVGLIYGIVWLCGTEEEFDAKFNNYNVL